jgi:hypothetical protein
LQWVHKIMCVTLAGLNFPTYSTIQLVSTGLAQWSYLEINTFSRYQLEFLFFVGLALEGRGLTLGLGAAALHPLSLEPQAGAGQRGASQQHQQEH